MTLPATTDVLIVGAGPTGLSLSAQLDRYGIDHVLVDRKEAVEDLSKAIVLHARTLEIYDQMGLAALVLEQGRILHKVQVANDGVIVAEPDFGAFGRNDSAFPFFAILP